MTLFYSCNPATGETVFQHPTWTPTELKASIARLRTAQQHWRASSVSTRATHLRSLGDQLLDSQAELAQLITLEVGKLPSESQAEIEKAARLCHYYADLAPSLLAPQQIATQASRSGVSFEPLGLVCAIMPWNYPVWQVLRFAVPALAAGNACLVKPAPSVPQTSARLLVLFQQAGLEVCDMAWIGTDQVETAIAASDAVAFTGSTATGRIIAATAGKHIKKTVLELGGSNAVIILADADLDAAAEEAVYSRYRDAGQSCNAAKRMIVVPEIADAFIARFLTHARALRSGTPTHPSTTLAPLHRADLRAELHAQVCDAHAHGAQILLGGELPNGAGYYYPATVLDQVTPACRVYHEEVFGPVATLLRAQDEIDAIRLANDTPFGLGATIYSRDTERAAQLAAALNVGSVYINRHTSSDLRLPFGGVKASGYGRELSEFGLYEFVNVKTFWQK